MSEEEEEKKPAVMRVLSRINLSEITRRQALHWQETGHPTTYKFDDYLDIWCLNPQKQYISAADDAETKLKLKEVEEMSKIAHIVAFTFSVAFYGVNRGFKGGIAWYKLFARHAVCLSIPSLILPKYLISNDQVEKVYIDLVRQREKYKDICEDAIIIAQVKERIEKLSSLKFVMEELKLDEEKSKSE